MVLLNVYRSIHCGLEYGVVPKDWEFYVVAISLHDRENKMANIDFPPIGGVSVGCPYK